MLAETKWFSFGFKDSAVSNTA